MHYAEDGLAMKFLVAAIWFVNNKTSDLTQFTSYAVIPGLATIVLTEVLIAGALCVLFYDSGSHSSFRRTKRLLNMLIIYAVNRCLLTLLLAVAQLVTSVLHQDAWSIGMDFIMAKLYANSLLASLNSREHLRSQISGTVSDLRIGTTHLANAL
ncbi:hypothetical protein BKA82DRAFT_22162 [Pisolithus tinctorius]|uniref:DUF6534 domain-containing protein n=1 Tax=Pisolithus tinctorius Marx 270 TaxID=870435 RepID=A0A0C3P8C0_PISTI|nr:hypothetical protein BKA82DRAFT_22162 [Pisolithus tinctorius]KIO09715.1 hypothetical protein M404DRAFT_22162 [Pisolithus tinctorius Marx 270]